ncbi:aminodeoxychorismate synthase component I [Aureimonas endophytica]|nr:aminodeoxychorismate synthase component I [Aureimonas endophytica]
MRQRELGCEEAIAVADRLAACPGFAFLDSAAASGGLGRYSFIGIKPFARFAVRDGRAFWNGTPLPGAPLDALRDALARHRLPRADGPVPFRGGAIGGIAYDFGRRLERLAEPAEGAGGDEMDFGFYDLVFAVDHSERRAWLFSSGLPEAEGAAREARAEARLAEGLALLREARPARITGSRSVGPWHSNFTAEGFAEAVARVQAYIRAGDIYQANIAQRFEAALPAGFDPWAFYKALRLVNPAPFGAFLSFGDRMIASASPERFLSCRDGAVEAHPIKGTARRSPDPAEDAALAARLVASEKDRAENVMIVDLLRNDLSKVARPGSVAVPKLCELQSFASVHHLVSVVTNHLRDGLGAADLLAAAFPGGSITGAPKLRAMDIITELEGAARGIYCGAIGYLGFDGDLDLNIAIRTVTLDQERARFHAGGGITLLSEPEAEYRETLAKAEGIFAGFVAHAVERPG